MARGKAETLDQNSFPVVNQLTGLQRLEIVKATPNTMDVICQRIAGGETLKDIAKCWGIPYGPFHIWIGSDDSRMKMYRNAQELMADSLLNEVVSIADTIGHVPDKRLRVQARLKVAEKLHPTHWQQTRERIQERQLFKRRYCSSRECYLYGDCKKTKNARIDGQYT